MYAPPVLPKVRRWWKESGATSLCGCGSARTCRSNVASCAIPRGSSGRCSKPQLKATSSRISRFSTNRSTAPTRDTICRMRNILLESFRGALTEPAPDLDNALIAELARAINQRARQRLGRSLAIRQVDAGSCNGCELEIHALNNAFYDLERFGLRFVASPRHADVLLVTGPVTKNMHEALARTYAATPDPKWVVAVGDCAFDGGLFAGS